MSDVALNRNNTGYRSPTWQRPESLGRPAGNRNYRNQREFRQIEHPEPDPDNIVDPRLVEFNQVRFCDSGIWPLDGPLPQWYRRVRTSTTDMAPPTVSGIAGDYLNKRTTKIQPADIVMTGGNEYRLYLYLGYCCWYPLYQDLLIVGRNQVARNRIVTALRSLHIYQPEELVAGCAARAAKDLLRAGMEQDWQQGYAAIAEAIIGCSWWSAVQHLVSGGTPMRTWQQIVVGGPFPLAVIDGMSNDAMRLQEAVQLNQPPSGLPPLDDLLGNTRDQPASEEDDLDDDFFASQEVEPTAEPSARSFRRVMLFNAETEPEL